MARRYKQIRYREDLTSLRERMNVTQVEIAGMVGVSRSSWQKYEYGDRNPQREAREKIEALKMKHPA